MARIRTEKPIRTEQEMFPLMENWLKSELTQKEFSQKHKLPLHILPYWIGRYRIAHSLPKERAPTPTRASFIQLTPPAASAAPIPSPNPTPAAITPKQVDSMADRTAKEPSVTSTAGNLDSKHSSGSAMEMEVAFPSGVKIHFSSLVPVSYLKELVGVCFR